MPKARDTFESDAQIVPAHQRRRPTRPACLLIACGNPCRSDDAVGWAVADAFEHELPQVARVIRCQQWTPELIADMAEAAAVALVDAAFDEAGVLQLVSAWSDVPLEPLGHAMTAHTLYAMARELLEDIPPVVLLTIGGANFELGERLDPRVAAAVPRAVELLAAWYASHLPAAPVDSIANSQ